MCILGCFSSDTNVFSSLLFFFLQVQYTKFKYNPNVFDKVLKSIRLVFSIFNDNVITKSFSWLASFGPLLFYSWYVLPTLSKEDKYLWKYMVFFSNFIWSLSPFFFQFHEWKSNPPPFPTFLIQLIFLVSGVHIMCDASAYPQFCRDLFYVNSNICFKCLILMIKTCLLGNAS